MINAFNYTKLKSLILSSSLVKGIFVYFFPYCIFLSPRFKKKDFSTKKIILPSFSTSNFKAFLFLILLSKPLLKWNLVLDFLILTCYFPYYFHNFRYFHDFCDLSFPEFEMALFHLRMRK